MPFCFSQRNRCARLLYYEAGYGKIKSNSVSGNGGRVKKVQNVYAPALKAEERWVSTTALKGAEAAATLHATHNAALR